MDQFERPSYTYFFKRLSFISGFILIVLGLLSGLENLSAQTVNIESARHKTDTVGFSGGIGLKGSFLDNGNKIYALNLAPDIQYKTDKSLYLLLADYNVNKSENISFQDAAFIHFRYNYKLSRLLRWEFFTQNQYNKIIKLKNRWLVGTGPRFRLYRDDVWRFYLGFIPMYEIEKIHDATETLNKNLRLSQYFSFTLSLNDQVKLYSTTYYQPVLSDWQNYRFYTDQKLKVNLNKNFSFTFSSLYTWDNKAPEGAPPRMLDMKAGLEYDF